MLKETAGAVGTVIALSPIGLPIVAHGFAGLLVGAAGLHLFNLFLNDIKGADEQLDRQQIQSKIQQEEHQV
jgi:hypothetical protein